VPLTLSDTEFEVAWETLRLGDLPLIFRVGIARHGRTDEERAALVASTMDGLRARRLADGRGVSGELADLLTMLANPRWVVDARLDIGRPVRGYGAAGSGDSAVLTTRDNGTVTLTGSTRYQLPADLAALAGDLRPGQGRSINLLVEVLLEASQRCAGDSHRLGDELIERGVPVGDARTVAKINDEMFGSGQFGVETLNAEGALRRASRVVGFCDTPEGRWAQLRTAGADGRDWVTFTPARAAQLAAMITDVLTECGAAGWR
jgi:EspG family